MKKVISGLLIASSLTSFAAFAGTTCPEETKAVLTCTTSKGSQYDVCEKKLSSEHQIRINGEVYSQNAEANIFDSVVQLQGSNYINTRFILELDPRSGKASLTEVDKYENPIGKVVKMSCKKP